MGRITLGFGTLILVLGFVIYQLGVFVSSQWEKFANQLPKFLSALDPPMCGMALQFVGGLTGILGLVVCIYGAVYSHEKRTLRELAFLLTSRLEERPIPAQRCKFCGAEIEEQAVFCPACNKSQK